MHIELNKKYNIESDFSVYTGLGYENIYFFCEL
jgi:hypothetical protein